MTSNSNQPQELFLRETGFDFTPERNVAYQRGREAGLAHVRDPRADVPPNPYETLTHSSFREDLFDLYTIGFDQTSGTAPETLDSEPSGSDDHLNTPDEGDEDEQLDALKALEAAREGPHTPPPTT